jgi:hypothetical protein
MCASITSTFPFLLIACIAGPIGSRAVTPGAAKDDRFGEQHLGFSGCVSCVGKEHQYIQSAFSRICCTKHPIASTPEDGEGLKFGKRSNALVHVFIHDACSLQKIQ